MSYLEPLKEKDCHLRCLIDWRRKVKEIWADGANISLENTGDATFNEAFRSLGNSDLIFEATDSFLTRELINEYAAMKKIPWIMTNSYGYFGEFMIIVPGETACLNCLTGGRRMIPLNCHAEQISPPVPSTVSVMGTSLLLKYFQDGIKDENFYFYSATLMELQKIKVNKVKECRVCSELIFDKLNDTKFLGRQIF